ncbi:SRPBCC domain-containing protein [Planotetraspora sp. GP83]|uniref:SRPBCC family protein n=1 Tax=Planotetraspora sp. GP83 TaxID=3156264 RepID=UPI003514ED71
MGRAFELRKEVELEATPGQVWEATATGPGVDSWFMGRNVVEPGEGGIVRLTLGGQSQENTVTAWEPGKRLAHRGAEPDDGNFMAFEYLLEGREGGGTVLRMVQSGVLGDDWETEYEAIKTGWDTYRQRSAPGTVRPGAVRWEGRGVCHGPAVPRGHASGAGRTAEMRRGQALSVAV